MNKTKLFSILSCAALSAVALASCNSGKGVRDTAAVHLLGSYQKVFYENWTPYEDVSNIIKKLKEEIKAAELAGYPVQYIFKLQLQLQSVKAALNNLAATFSISNLIECKPSAGSSIEYGKDVELDIYPKNEFVLLANNPEGSTKTDYNIMHTPYKGLGYAVPYVGYGNALKPHVAKLPTDLYTYTQDSTDKQKFHLHVDGSAFNKNLVIDFGMDGEDLDNSVSIMTSTYLIHDDKDNSRIYVKDDTDGYEFIQQLSGKTANATPFDILGKGDVYSEGMQFTFGLNNDNYWSEKINKNMSTTIYSNVGELNARQHYGYGAGSKNFLNFKGYTFGEDFKVYGKKGTNEPVELKNIKTKVTNSTTYYGDINDQITITIPWSEIHNMTETGLKYDRLYDYIYYSFDKEPKKACDIDVKTYDSTKATIIDKGYGHIVGNAFGLVKDETEINILNDKVYNEINGDLYNSIRGDSYKYRDFASYRTTIKQKQEDETKTGEITWPHVNIVKTLSNGTSVTETFDYTALASETSWRVSELAINQAIQYDDDGNLFSEGELPYRVSSNGDFVMICLNPANRTLLYVDNELKDPEEVKASLIKPVDAEKHNLFIIYDTSSSSYQIAGYDCASTVFNIVDPTK